MSAFDEGGWAACPPTPGGGTPPLRPNDRGRGATPRGGHARHAAPISVRVVSADADSRKTKLAQGWEYPLRQSCAAPQSSVARPDDSPLTQGKLQRRRGSTRHK